MCFFCATVALLKFRNTISKSGNRSEFRYFQTLQNEKIEKNSLHVLFTLIWSSSSEISSAITLLGSKCERKNRIWLFISWGSESQMLFIHIVGSDYHIFCPLLRIKEPCQVLFPNFFLFSGCFYRQVKTYRVVCHQNFFVLKFLY